MAPSGRKLLAPVLLALAGTALLAWLGLATTSFTDYEQEAEPALNALRDGDLHGFLARLPAYGGSLILRSPFALLPDLFDGGQLAVFRSMAVPCLAAGAALGVLLWARARKAGLPGTAAYLALALCTVNPITLRTLEYGHPEELLGGVLCVAAALAALGRRPVAAGLLLGLAVANKPWAVLAVVPVLVVLDRGHLRALAAAGAAATVLVAPMVLGDASGVQAARSVATTTGHLFQPWQVWWFAGDYSHVVAARPELPGAARMDERDRAPVRDPASPAALARPVCAGCARGDRRTGSSCWPWSCCCAACSTPGTSPTTRCPSCWR